MIGDERREAEHDIAPRVRLDERGALALEVGLLNGGERRPQPLLWSLAGVAARRDIDQTRLQRCISTPVMSKKTTRTYPSNEREIVLV
jgi:hypothetical protein